MNYRKWPGQSVLWIFASVSLFVIEVGWDFYDWKAHGKPFGTGKLFDDCVFAVIVGWAATLSSQARGVAFLTWISAVIATIVGRLTLEKMVHLSLLPDAARDRMFVLFPLLVAVGATLFWRRRERIKEIQTMR